jgi:hypothetical protein
MLEKIDPVQVALQAKRKLHAEGVRPFPGKAASSGGGAGRASVSPTTAAGMLEETDRASAAASTLRGGFTEDAKSVTNDLQLLVDLVGPDGVGDDEIAELMRSSTSAPTETAGFLRLDQSKLPLEMFDDEVHVARCARVLCMALLFSPRMH